MVIGESLLTRKNPESESECRWKQCAPTPSSPTASKNPIKTTAHNESKGDAHFANRAILPNFLVAWKFNIAALETACSTRNNMDCHAILITKLLLVLEE